MNEIPNSVKGENEESILSTRTKEFEFIADSAECQQGELIALIKNPIAIITALGVLAMGCSGLMVAFIAVLVIAVESNATTSHTPPRYSYWRQTESVRELNGESGMVSGSMDQRDIRNSVIGVDGEVLNMPN